MSFFDLVEEGISTVGTIVGGAIGGPPGAAIGGGAGGLLGAAVDWLSGDDGEPPSQTQQQGLPTPPTSGGGQVSLPSQPGGGGQVSLPSQPSGGMTGPVYSSQGVPSALSGAVKTVIELFAQNPGLGKVVQRVWDFPRAEQTRNQHSDAAWAQLANQLPKSNREALEQFLLGFSAPIGLSKRAEDAFLLLTIAEAGYEPHTLGLCDYGGN